MPRESSAEERMTAVAQAHTAFRQLRTSTSDERRRWLVGIAEAVEEHRSALVAVADDETTLGAGRLNGELDRTIYQLHHFGDAIAKEKHRRAIDQPGDPDASPQPRPSLKQMRVPLGPVAVWGASNFPFAFGVLGGDTASALAAGCPVITVEHPGHPRTSELL
ncbi:MAG: aldehyde dehydrogenase family protein, partial [Candidatus Nanopelagicales bacterium]|nr:aldehyde dehydrogenase family protein [Candidatus Nanopelagicales bacterium]